jgi:alpha-galactosidase
MTSDQSRTTRVRLHRWVTTLSLSSTLLVILIAVGLFVMTTKRMSPGDAYARLMNAPIQTIVLPLTQHTMLTAVTFEDVTDHHNELVQVDDWLLHPTENHKLKGNLFIFENVLDQTGKIAMKLGPLPEIRAVKSDWDVAVSTNEHGGYTARLRDDKTYPWQIIDYTGGKLGQTRALHQAQRKLMASHEINFLSNTWGDRSQDSRMNEAFILKEIEAGVRLGVEVIQLDDGWQKGRTMNSVDAEVANGQWEGFHDQANDFWSPDPVRFPHGFKPILDAADQAGVEIGLWYGLDSAKDFANWQEDVKTVIGLHQQYGIRHFKFDAINSRTPRGEENLNAFFDELSKQSNQQIIVDLDITYNRRPGYFGRIDCGPLFVTNRYSDWHNYWPHQTLRNLWQLSRWVDPMRMRMMFLNNTRNTELYVNDPLAPQHVSPESLFAPLMFSQPLGWFENSNLPSEYFEQVRPLVDLWKQHRQAIHAGVIYPVGTEPDGVNWAGFVSINEQQATGYLLVCNAMQETVDLGRDLPKWAKVHNLKQLAGHGLIASDKGNLLLTQMPNQSFWFGTFTLKE